MPLSRDQQLALVILAIPMFTSLAIALSLPTLISATRNYGAFAGMAFFGLLISTVAAIVYVVSRLFSRER